VLESENVVKNQSLAWELGKLNSTCTNCVNNYVFSFCTKMPVGVTFFQTFVFTSSEQTLALTTLLSIFSMNKHTSTVHVVGYRPSHVIACKIIVS